MGTPVTVLVIDPVRGHQREVEAGETLVDGDGNPILFPGFGPPVDDIPALKAVTADRRVDQQVRLVEDADPNTPGVDYPSNYAWDSTSTEADDPGEAGRPPAVVVPDDAPATGRWIRVYSEVNPHYETHEIGGSDEITVENLITGEYGAGSSSSSPGAGDPIKMLVPDGGGGVMWIDLDLSIEELSTDELATTKVLQPDGSGGVHWLDDLTLAAGGKVVLDPGDPTWFEANNDYMYCYADKGFDVEGDSTGTVSMGVYNTNLGAAAAAQIWAFSDGDGDAWVTLGDGVATWSFGVDADYGPGNFVFKVASSLSSGGPLELASTGDVKVGNTLSTGSLGAVGGPALAVTTIGGLYGVGGDVIMAVGGNAIMTFVSGGAVTLTTGGQIKNVTDPTTAQDVATKAYVDAQIGANNDLDEILSNGNDAMGQSIEGLCGIYFATGCGDGSSSSESSGELVSSILPDNDRLHYSADGGHVFGEALTIEGYSESGLIFDRVDIAAQQWKIAYQGSGSDMGFYFYSSSQYLNFFFGGDESHEFQRDHLSLYRSDGGSVWLEVESYTAIGYVEVSGLSGASADASRFRLDQVGSANNWWIVNRGKNYVGEVDDCVFLYQNGAVEWMRFDVDVDAIAIAKDLNVVGHVETDDAYYLGAVDTDGSWRIRRDDWDLVFEHYDSEGWHECDRISGCASSSSSA